MQISCDKFHLYIHPFSSTYPIQVAVGLEPIPAVTDITRKDTLTHTFTTTNYLESPINPTGGNLTRVPGENRGRHMENMHTDRHQLAETSCQSTAGWLPDSIQAASHSFVPENLRMSDFAVANLMFWNKLWWERLRSDCENSQLVSHKPVSKARIILYYETQHDQNLWYVLFNLA